MQEKILLITINKKNTLSVLQRIASLLSRNRINIEQLTVFKTANVGISNFDIVIHCTQNKFEKIVKKIANVIDVIDINNQNS